MAISKSTEYLIELAITKHNHHKCNYSLLDACHLIFNDFTLHPKDKRLYVRLSLRVGSLKMQRAATGAGELGAASPARASIASGAESNTASVLRANSRNFSVLLHARTYGSVLAVCDGCIAFVSVTLLLVNGCGSVSFITVPEFYG